LVSSVVSRIWMVNLCKSLMWRKTWKTNITFIIYFCS
jgi:hypothetical protein